MGWIDITIIVLMIIGAFNGLRKGFISQLASLAGLIVGFIVAKALYLVVAERLSLYITDTSMTVVQIIAFILIWLVIPMIFALAASFFTQVAKKLSLGGFNRMLGFIFGGLKWVLVIGIFFNVLDFVDKDSKMIERTKKQESSLYYPIKNFVSDLFPVAKNVTNDYIYT